MSNFLTRDEAQAIDNLMPGNAVYGLGSKMKFALDSVGAIGSVFYLDATNGDDGYDGTSPDKAKKTLPAAYALLTANKNDVLFVIPGASSLVLSAEFTWGKNFTHLIAVGAPLRFGGRARIGHAGTPIGTMFIVSGSGCIFKNIHFQHGQASATNLVCVSVSGLRNYFEGCHFESSLDTIASGGSYAWRAVSLAASAQANGFYRCTFGTWTRQWASTAGRLMQFMGDNADTYVEDCIFIGNASAAMKYIGFTGAISGANSEVDFRNCQFKNIGTAITGGIFEIPTNGHIMVDNCKYFGFTIWSATNANLHVWGVASAATGGIATTPA